MGEIFTKVETFAKEDGTFEAAIHVDNSKVATTTRFDETEKAEFLDAVRALYNRKVLELTMFKDAMDGKTTK
jgi:hypothetical protein